MLLSLHPGVVRDASRLLSLGPGVNQHKPRTRPHSPSSTVCSTSAAQDAACFKNGLPLPQPWNWQSNPLGQTIWTVRLETAGERGSYLRDDTSGVLLGLVGQQGKSWLHRISALNDPDEVNRELGRILQAAAEEGWKRHEVPQVRTAVIPRQWSGEAGKRRFQESSVDEVSFLGPELGPLAGLMLGTESGRWKCGEVTVSSSRSMRQSCVIHTDRFLCNEWIGRGHSSAVYLKPVPADCVVYGSVVITNEQAVKMHAMGMRRYEDLKDRLLNFTAGLVASGSLLTTMVGGPDMAYPFALGGGASYLYMKLLQKGVDALPGGVGYMLPAALVNRYKGLMSGPPGGMVDLLPTSASPSEGKEVPAGGRRPQGSGASRVAQKVEAGGVDSSLAGIFSFMGQKEGEGGRFPAPQANPLQAAREAAASHLFRFASVSALCFGVVVGIHHLEPLRGVTSQTQQIRTLIAGFLGFMMFKVAVLGVAAMPVPSDDIPAQRRW